MQKSIFNEDVYFRSPETLKKFKEIHEKQQAIWDKEQETFSNEIQKYDILIEEIAELIKKLGYHSSLDCSIILSYMISHGYLSYDQTFKGQNPNPETEISICLGTSIIRGEGCCRNYAKMHQDVFNRLKRSSQLFYCYEGSKFFGIEKNHQANHVINLIWYDNNVYGIDTYNNNHLFHFNSALSMKEVSTTLATPLRYKPYYELLTGESTLKDIKEKLIKYKEYSNRPIINPFIYEDEIVWATKIKMDEHSSILRDFHEKTKVLKKELKESIEKKFKK